ncbi:MAG: hypothetical protein WCF03_21080 [Nitrososphaeraceae archaeon]
MTNIDNTAVTVTGNNDRVIIDGITPIVCIFCKHYMTSIEFDLDLHLCEKHRMELVNLPIGKGNMNVRIEYAIEDGKRVGATLQTLSKEVKEKLGFGSH